MSPPGWDNSTSTKKRASRQEAHFALLDISLGAKRGAEPELLGSKDSQSSNRIRVCDGERGRRQEIDAGGHHIVEAIILLESEATSRGTSTEEERGSDKVP